MKWSFWSRISLKRDSRKIVFFTGAGISKESGISTFREPQTGLWEQYDPQQLCTASSLEQNPQLVLDFYNMRRMKIYNAKPNHAHEVIAGLEKYYDVTVITQNVDNLHERAGSTNVWHVHGDLSYVTSSANRLSCDCIQPYPLNVPIKVGDKAADGSQLRPFVVMMDEYLPSLDLELEAIANADIFVIVGTSLSIGAGLVLPPAVYPYIPKFIIDPCDHRDQLRWEYTWINAPATTGMDILVEKLKEL